MSEEIVHEEDEVLDEDAVETEPETNEADTAEASEDVEELKKRLAKAEAALVKSKKKAKAQSTKTTPDTDEDEVPEWGKKILEADKKRNFGYEQNLAPETVDKLYQYSGGNLSAELLNDPAAKGIVRAMESARRNAANTPSGGSTPTYKGRTYAETATDPNATPADKQAAFDATAKRLGIKK